MGTFYLDHLGRGGGVSGLKDTLYFGFNELKVSTLDNNRDFKNTGTVRRRSGTRLDSLAWFNSLLRETSKRLRVCKMMVVTS